MEDLLDNPLVFFALFIAMWICIGFLISLIGGWHALSELYAADAGQFSGKRKYMQSAAMRWNTHYNNVLTIGADARGLYLGVLFLFRIGHPPLYIPWESVVISERRGWIFTYVVFDFKAVPGVRLMVSKKLGVQVSLEGRQSIGPSATHQG
jgi:hypothetical protein